MNWSTSDSHPLCRCRPRRVADCFAFWSVLRLGRSAWWLAPGVLSLVVFAYLLTLVEAAAAGRAFAAYGGEAQGHEGIVAKRKGSRYSGGRCSAWRKTKTAGWRAANGNRWRAFESD